MILADVVAQVVKLVAGEIVLCFLLPASLAANLVRQLDVAILVSVMRGEAVQPSCLNLPACWVAAAVIHLGSWRWWRWRWKKVEVERVQGGV